MDYKIITKPDCSEQKLAVYDGKCRFWMEGLYDGLPDTCLLYTSLLLDAGKIAKVQPLNGLLCVLRRTGDIKAVGRDVYKRQAQYRIFTIPYFV